MRQVTIRRSGGNGCLQILVLPLTVVGALLVYGAAGTWLGIAQALGGDRTAGVVQQVTCSRATHRRGCSGLFTADDRGIRDLRVAVEGSGRRAGATRATLVRRIDVGPLTTIQTRDTAYVGSVSVGVAGPIVLAVFLSLGGLLLISPALYLTASSLWNMTRPSSR